MDFKKEYKAAAESMTPSREQLDRMKANILRQTAKPRKPAFTRAAYIGGTVAACAVVTLTAVTLLPVLKNAGKLTNSNQNVLSGSSAPETSAAFWGIESAKDTAADSELDETPVFGDNADCVPVETEEFSEYSYEISIDDILAESEEWANDEGAENPGMAGEVPVVPNDVTGSGIVDTVLTDKSDTVSTADNAVEISATEEPADYLDEPEELVETEEWESVTEEWEEWETAEFEDEWFDEPESGYDETCEYVDETCEYIDETCEYIDETCESASETMEEDWVDYEKPIERSPPDLDPEVAVYRPNKLILSDNQKTLWFSYRYPRLSGTFKYAKTDFFIDVSAETDFPPVYDSAELCDVRSGRTFGVEFTAEDGSSIWLYDDSGHFIGEYIKE